MRRRPRTSSPASGPAPLRTQEVMTVEPETVLAGHPLALTALRWALATCRAEGPTDVRATKSQVALRRRRGFAYLWLPGRYLAKPAADVVLSIALPRRLECGRWKQVVQPSPRTWLHHLEVRAESDLDDEVAGWLREAWQAAG